MSRSAFWGISIILLLSIVPVFLLFQYGPSASLSYSDVTQKLGQISALIGVTLFALTFVLSTRFRIIEDAFGGLDKVYMTHGIIGSIALVLLLFHPILLVLKFIPSNFNLAAQYLLPGSYWSVNFGMIALLGLAILIGVTIYSKVKYQKWKFSHEFLGAIFMIAILHIFLIRTSGARDYIFNGYYVFAAIVSFIGMSAFLYSLLLRDKISKHKTYRIKDIQTYSKGTVFRITFAPEKDALKYKSGQFVFLRFFNKKMSSEPHPFSIASKSDDPELKVYIKKLGDYTSELSNLKVGDKTIIEGPYGKFNFTNTKSNLDQVWAAGGIGITPFIGMAQDLTKDMKKNITLYYAVNFEDELLELEIFNAIAKNNKNFQVIPWIKDKNGYLDAKAIKEHSGSLKNKEFYICGPPGMKGALAKGLIESGVKDKRIIMEDFSFR
jgi:predicted ferric reductase